METNIRKQCKELTYWAGYKTAYKIKVGKTRIYSMTSKVRGDILSLTKEYLKSEEGKKDGSL